MDGFRWTDSLVLVVLGLVIFGPKRLPEFGSSIGAALRELRNPSVREHRLTPVQRPTRRLSR